MKRIGTLCTRYNNKYFAKPFRISFLCIRGGRVNGDRIYRRLCAIFWLNKQVLVKTKKCTVECRFQTILSVAFRPVYTTSVLGTAPLKMGTRAQKFRHGTSAFWRVNVAKIGTGATKFKRSSKRCRAQFWKKIKNMSDIEHAQNKLSCNLPKIKKNKVKKQI